MPMRSAADAGAPPQYGSAAGGPRQYSGSTDSSFAERFQKVSERWRSRVGDVHSPPSYHPSAAPPHPLSPDDEIAELLGSAPPAAPTDAYGGTRVEFAPSLTSFAADPPPPQDVSRPVPIPPNPSSSSSSSSSAAHGTPYRGAPAPPPPLSSAKRQSASSSWNGRQPGSRDQCRDPYRDPPHSAAAAAAAAPATPLSRKERELREKERALNRREQQLSYLHNNHQSTLEGQMEEMRQWSTLLQQQHEMLGQREADYRARLQTLQRREQELVKQEQELDVDPETRQKLYWLERTLQAKEKDLHIREMNLASAVEEVKQREETLTERTTEMEQKARDAQELFELLEAKSEKVQRREEVVTSREGNLEVRSQVLSCRETDMLKQQECHSDDTRRLEEKQRRLTHWAQELEQRQHVFEQSISRREAALEGRRRELCDDEARLVQLARGLRQQQDSVDAQMSALRTEQRSRSREREAAERLSRVQRMAESLGQGSNLSFGQDMPAQPVHDTMGHPYMGHPDTAQPRRSFDNPLDPVETAQPSRGNHRHEDKVQDTSMQSNTTRVLDLDTSVMEEQEDVLGQTLADSTRCHRHSPREPIHRDEEEAYDSSRDADDEPIGSFAPPPHQSYAQPAPATVPASYIFDSDLHSVNHQQQQRPDIPVGSPAAQPPQAPQSQPIPQHQTKPQPQPRSQQQRRRYYEGPVDLDPYTTESFVTELESTVSSPVFPQTAPGAVEATQTAEAPDVLSLPPAQPAARCTGSDPQEETCDSRLREEANTSLHSESTDVNDID